MSAVPRRLGRVVVLSEGRVRHPGSWDPALDRVLAGRTLAVAFQPIVQRRRATDGRSRWDIVGAEALVRAHAERGSVLRPDKLLPIVERAGLMHRLFLFVLAEGLASARTWERQIGARLELSVNLHAAALLDDALPQFLLGLLDASDFAPSRLTLELTETTPISDLQHAAKNLRALRRSGVRVALDDFGAGFSTTTRLAWLECDELKIDKALVHGLERSEEQRCVVEHLVSLAHENGMSACAEGVETDAALRLLGAFGCDRAQGFLIARPQPAAEVQDLVHKWRSTGDIWAAPQELQMTLPGLGLETDYDYDCDFRRQDAANARS
jgi:EAL domain-containing protein (putative c-di-GMP-specific phosphodiesterase class I)